jgi:hypothetical protein
MTRYPWRHSTRQFAENQRFQKCSKEPNGRKANQGNGNIGCLSIHKNLTNAMQLWRPQQIFAVTAHDIRLIFL